MFLCKIARPHVVCINEGASPGDSHMIEWPPSPDGLHLQPGQLHVWAVELDEGDFNSDRVFSVLSPHEQSRAARFKFERDRRRYLIAHTALRQILSRYLETVGADLQFSEVGNGKPILAGALGGSGVHFNLSHSHQRALIAVAQGCEVGVDIEFVKADFSFDEVAERFFTAREVAELRALPTHLQRQAFYKCWTSKEAFLKAKGTGLSGKLDEVEVTLDEDERVRINACVPGWSLAELNPGDGYQGAVVSESDLLPLDCFRWQPMALP